MLLVIDSRYKVYPIGHFDVCILNSIIDDYVSLHPQVVITVSKDNELTIENENVLF